MNSEKEEALNERIRKLVLLDVDAFLQKAGVDKKQLIICLEREKGRSLQYIASQVQLPKSTVERRCKKCPEKRDDISK